MRGLSGDYSAVSNKACRRLRSIEIFGASGFVMAAGLVLQRCRDGEVKCTDVLSDLSRSVPRTSPPEAGDPRTALADRPDSGEPPAGGQTRRAAMSGYRCRARPSPRQRGWRNSLSAPLFGRWPIVYRLLRCSGNKRRWARAARGQAVPLAAP